VRARFGRDEIQLFDDWGLLAGDLRLAHGVQITEAHRQRIRDCRVSVCHCPSSNLKLGSGIADVPALVAAGIPVSLGADGPPCNNDLDPFEEVRLAALLQKLSDPSRGSGLDALRLATSGGARALGLEREVGSLEVGKQGDVVVLSVERPELFALGSADAEDARARLDLHDLVAFAAKGPHVRHVTIAGELLVEEGRLTRLDLDQIRRRATASLRAVIARADLP
jgi:cytosine/adenosine deaminase-related metal-dependent hydrolase